MASSSPLLRILRRVVVVLVLVLGPGLAQGQEDKGVANPPLRFQFGEGRAAAGFIQVLPTAVYSDQRGYGFEPGAQLVSVNHDSQEPDPLHCHAVTSNRPFYFSVRVPREGNYRVRVTLGDRDGESVTTICAELRRLMVEKVATRAGHFATVEFVVNTRTPKIQALEGIPAGVVKLKAPRETTQEAWDWDDRITLEFNNRRPVVCAVEVEPVVVPTVFLIGDSTVCDQSKEPYNSWGQMLPNFMKPDVAVANHAESGETYRDSIGRRRLDKILSVMRPGDYLLMQFGHNDQKQIAAGTGGPFTTYKSEMRRHVEGVRSRGGIPIIVSPMERRNFNPDGTIRPTLGDYAQACRQVASEMKVAFIDLNAQSILLYQALGSGKAYLAFAGTGEKRDPTHHDDYGSYELAKIIAQALRTSGLPVAQSIRDDLAPFDPRHPDPVESFDLPPSASYTNERPLGD